MVHQSPELAVAFCLTKTCVRFREVQTDYFNMDGLPF